MIALGATLALGAALFGGAPAVASGPHALPPTPPPNPSASSNPTDAQLQAASNNKTALAQLIGTINGKIASNKVELSQQRAKLLYAEQVMALKVSKEQAAKSAATKAKKAVTTATRKSETARRAYVQFVQAAYYGSDGTTTSGALLTAGNPSDVLERSTLVGYQAHNKTVAIKRMQTAQVTKSNAEAKARSAKLAATKAATAARTATNTAASLYRSTQTTAQNLQANLGTQQTLLGQAQERLATLNGQRATYLAAKTRYNDYIAEKKRLAAIAAAKLRAQQEAAAAARAARAASHSGSSNSGGGHQSSGGGGSSSSGSDDGPSAPSGGNWTAAKGRKAAQRALSTLGIMYAWAGGNAYGPTRGVCAGDGAWNDCNVTGYDCSGLAMYAWGASWDHFAATQYRQAGSYHPSVDNLMPGDLLFWSYGNSYDIHHVAIYIGHGEMVEAPESNVAIRTASIYEYGNISYTTRPLT